MGACLIQEKPEIRLDCLGNGYGFGLSIFLRKGLIVAQASRDLTVQSGLAPNSQRYSSLCPCLPSAGNRFFVLFCFVDALTRFSCLVFSCGRL